MSKGSVLDKSIFRQDVSDEIPGISSSRKKSADTVAGLKDIALACVAWLIFQERNKPTTPEELFLYEVRQRLPRQGDELLAALHESLQRPGGDDIALLNLAHHYQLHWLEILTIALTLAVEQDAMVGRALAYVQAPVGASRPTLGLLESALDLLDIDKAEFKNRAVSASLLSGKAMEIGLLQTMNDTAPIPEQALQIPQTIAIALQGSWQAINGASIAGFQDTLFLPESISRQAVRHASALGKAKRRALIIRSTSTQEANTIVKCIANELQLTPLLVKPIANDAEPLGILCVIANLLPVFQLSVQMIGEQSLPELTGYDGPIIAITGPDGVIRSGSYSAMNWVIQVPNRDERFHIWSQYISNQQLAAELAKDHMHSAGRIAELAGMSMREAEIDHRDKQSIDDIHKASWSHCSDELAALADAVKNRIHDDALILTPTTQSDLHMLLQRCRNRETLVENLGVSFSARYQPGVRSLFIGPSGTGKTLAAAWLATKLSMPLYRVDLASVMSKYIGETEKNLAGMLARAERSDVILLFDEADSLFGKRTDIKDANDRYANTQTNYLLQRIENYQGIVLLTSNSRSRFDSAFTRRIDLIIDFPAPGPQERRALWYSHLGSQHELSTAKINQLSATLDICGGHIRNAVLAASVLAQNEQRQINYQDVIQGLKLEYKKLAKKLPVELVKGS